MSHVAYHLVHTGDESTLTLFLPNGPETIHGDHPGYEEIVDLLDNQESCYEDELLDELTDLLDPGVAIGEKFEQLTDRVAVKNGRLFFDHDDITSGPLAQHILRFLEEGIDDWKPLVNFMEKLAANPQNHTKHRFYGWLEATGGFTIADDGDVIGYKGVNRNRSSIHSGPAIVDGEDVNGNVPNLAGSVIEFSREQVEHNPSVGCSTGLHVGTWEYASGFGPRTIRVKFSPRDVVSVPTDAGDQKVRVCRYQVLTEDDVSGKTDAALEVLGG